ncbi:C40 family peptidase [Microtetraspora sp. NBRC 16547]|uniref:C40 family peptidase n=1 Tax=Microtetraspora sp. NBRC 16547 TaxID=3030993 RepID=UPI00249FC91A|nr:C40 family peptidase [Microtetraspora sp. NBRC 16547]GLW98790.1 lipoprotein [Microtetraspora sp. NBRC 16547]
MRLAAAGAAALLLLLVVLSTVVADVFTRSGGPGVCAVPVRETGRMRELNDEQVGNAATIIDVAVDLELPARAAVIAVATGMQESRLRNLTYGHRDSVGLFQQRPSQGWGSREEILDPRHATRSFYRRLTAVSGWERIPLARAAQAVQHSAYPEEYARWEPLAQRVVDAFIGACAAVIPGERAASVIAYAQAQLGKPYVWGAEGPRAFDCSGLAMRAYQAAGITIPRVTYDQWRHGARIPRGEEQPGDLAFFRMESDGPGHVGIVLGNGQMIHAPQTGDIVKIAPYARADLVGFTRPSGMSRPTDLALRS